MLQVFPVALEDVKTTFPPAQKVNGPPADTVGTGGFETSVTIVDALADVQPLASTKFTVYVPEVLTVIDCVVAPVLHVFPVVLDDVNVTLPPVQNVVGPLAEIVGALGKGFTVIVDEAVEDVQPFPSVTLTVYAPAALTVMDCVVAPVLHVFPIALDDVNVILFPAQKVVGPLAETTGALGNAFTVTVVFAEVAVQPAAPTVTE